jgi:L-ascorbate metabolism protein UlaG (beta-lactamase superfamily)
MLRVDYLNHASVLVRVGDFALLTDPWFGGNAFSGGWGLQYENPAALELAAQATHLWISHWHSDHLHIPTLEALAARNPSLVALANVSANFSMHERLQAAGFRQLRPLYERKRLALADGIEVERFPTAGIDNALVLRAPGFTVLNYNDCNLPAGAVKALKRRIGRIDLLLSNYNHAGKLFAPRPVADEKDAQWRTLEALVELLDPKVAVPFASSHYYRVQASWEQNESLLGFDEIERRAARDARIMVLRIGDRLDLASRTDVPHRVRAGVAAQPVVKQVHEYGPSAHWEDLIEVATNHCKKLRRAFPLLARTTEPLLIAVSDHARCMELDCRTGRAEAAESPETAHIATHSRALFQWLGRPFGADTFVAGAHFALLDADTRVIERWALLSLLHASHMSERDALRYAASREGWWFLWCRREEIFATLKRGTLKAGQARLV